ncbi:MAG: ABC transporter permease [Actinobacteria bacterium]|nr:ABC transporter permease [Actinomycetota bacterium]
MAAVLVLSTPLLLASVGELVSERTGVLNVGLEGMMLAGTFSAYYVAYLTGSPVWALFGGIAGGLVFGLVMGGLAVQIGADQIVSGVGINLAAIGVTGFFFDEIFGNKPQTLVSTIGNVSIPGLSKIPVIGNAFFDRNPIVYLAFALVPAVWWLLFRSKWGLAIRAVGETPEAAEAAGISARRVRWLGALTAAGLAGLAGAYLVVVEVGIFKQEMTNGRGFLALVAVIFGRWRPGGVLIACVVLGGADALQLRLADDASVPRVVWAAVLLVVVIVALWMITRRRRRSKAMPLTAAVGILAAGLCVIAPHVALPNELWRSLPFILALIVLAGSATTARMPSKLGLEFRRGE